jgi:hypothetical protein
VSVRKQFDSAWVYYLQLEKVQFGFNSAAIPLLFHIITVTYGGIYPAVGRDFLFAAERNPYPALSVIVSQLFLPRDHY